MGGFFYVLLAPVGRPGTDVGDGLAAARRVSAATTMTFAGIIACQIGTAFAARDRARSLRSVGVFSNRLLLWGIAFEIAFTAAIVYVPALQGLFGTAALAPMRCCSPLPFPLIVWGVDGLVATDGVLDRGDERVGG